MSEAASQSGRGATIRPFRGPTTLIAGALGGLVLWSGCFPSAYYLFGFFSIPAFWCFSIFAVGVHTACAGILNRVRGRTSEVSFEGAATLGGWLVFVTGAFLLHLPLHLHFAIAQDELETTRRESLDYHRAGAFLVEEVGERGNPGCTFLAVRNDSESYFAYCPNGVEELDYNHGSDGSLGDGWHWIAED